ncbi:MAG: hypothetical protein ACREP9_19995, partial [Candidatus Dormibacteraceae bacterium]
PLLSNALARIRRDGAPFTAPATNYWVDTSFDLPAIARTLSLNWHLPANWPKIQCTVHGEGENVRTLGQLDFPQPLAMDLPAWNIPTNLIHDPLISFCAVRGVAPLLNALPFWKELGLKTSPDQVFVWGQGGMPTLEYLAAPWSNAINAVQKISEHLIRAGNPWLSTKLMGHFSRPTSSDGVVWENAPFITPGLRSISEAGGDFALAGLVPLLRTNAPLPDGLLNEMYADPRRVLYHWEITGPKVEQVQYLSQLGRLIDRKPQLRTATASLEWLKAVGPKLGNCVSVLSLGGSSQIAFTRKSSLGLDSIELHILVDWLESARFPIGFYTLEAPPSIMPPSTR